MDRTLKRLVVAALALFLVTICGPLNAQTVILLQGYLGSGNAWRETGATRQLQRSGWADAGALSLRGGQVVGLDGSADQGRRFVTIDLPTEAPMMVQERVLSAYVTRLQARYPDDSLALAGHSAGGVVARLYMVRHPETPVSLLVTIASPNRGTESAEIGLMAGQSPLGWIAPMLGAGVLSRSQGLYYDLARENPGNLLGWLNRQPHPEAVYVSVVRRKDGGVLGMGDMVVPEWSQDLNGVIALRGRARTIYSDEGHGLTPGDGEMLLHILESLRRV